MLIAAQVKRVSVSRMRDFFYIFLPVKVLELVGGGSVINGAYPVQFIVYLGPPNYLSLDKTEYQIS